MLFSSHFVATVADMCRSFHLLSIELLRPVDVVRFSSGTRKTPFICFFHSSLLHPGKSPRSSTDEFCNFQTMNCGNAMCSGISQIRTAEIDQSILEFFTNRQVVYLHLPSKKSFDLE